MEQVVGGHGKAVEGSRKGSGKSVERQCFTVALVTLSNAPIAARKGLVSLWSDGSTTARKGSALLLSPSSPLLPPHVIHLSFASPSRRRKAAGS